MAFSNVEISVLNIEFGVVIMSFAKLTVTSLLSGLSVASVKVNTSESIVAPVYRLLEVMPATMEFNAASNPSLPMMLSARVVPLAINVMRSLSTRLWLLKSI